MEFVQERLDGGSIHDLGIPGAGTILQIGECIASAWSNLMFLDATGFIGKYRACASSGLPYDLRLLWRCISQLSAVPMHDVEDRRFLKGDWMHKAMQMLVFKKQCETWEIFAVQILLDILRELGPLLPVADRLLEKTGRDLAQDHRAYFNIEGLEELGEVRDFMMRGICAHLRQNGSSVLDGKLQSYIDECEESVMRELERNLKGQMALTGERIEYSIALSKFSLLPNHPS